MQGRLLMQVPRLASDSSVGQVLVDLHNISILSQHWRSARGKTGCLGLQKLKLV